MSKYNFWVKFSLIFLRIYVLFMLGLLFYKFYQVLSH
jgi:hypothetical protein